jgi:hypothetical protein
LDAKRERKNSNVSQRDQCVEPTLGWGQYCARFHTAVLDQPRFHAGRLHAHTKARQRIVEHNKIGSVRRRAERVNGSFGELGHWIASGFRVSSSRTPHKLREALGKDQDAARLASDVEIDGAYFGGYVNRANYKQNRMDRRLAMNQTGKRRVVVVMRERNGRTLPFVSKSEHNGLPRINAAVTPGSTIFADDAKSWDALHAHYSTKRINHLECYSDGEACTNFAESYYSGLRRADIGTHHKIVDLYLSAYADEMAWREDNRRPPIRRSISTRFARC